MNITLSIDEQVAQRAREASHSGYFVGAASNKSRWWPAASTKLTACAAYFTRAKASAYSTRRTEGNDSINCLSFGS